MKSFKQEIYTLDYFNNQENINHQIEHHSIFGRNYHYFKPHHNKFDKKFIKIVQEIEQDYRNIFYSKPDQIRIEQWVRKLCENCCDKSPLMKNRNKYIKLLRMCVLDIKRLEGIFKKMPPTDGEDLKIIQNHEILDIEHFAKNSKKRKQSEKRAKEMYNFNSNRAREEKKISKSKHYKINVNLKKTRNNLNDHMSNSSSLNQTPTDINKENHYYKQLQKSIISIFENKEQSKTTNKSIFSTTISPINKSYLIKPGQIVQANRTPKHNFKNEGNSQRSKSLVNLKTLTVPRIHTESVISANQSIQSTSRSRRSRADRNAEARSKSYKSNSTENSSQKFLMINEYQANTYKTNVQMRKTNHSTEFTLAKCPTSSSYLGYQTKERKVQKQNSQIQTNRTSHNSQDFGRPCISLYYKQPPIFQECAMNKDLDQFLEQKQVKIQVQNILQEHEVLRKETEILLKKGERILKRKL